jgi:hypothetical protein
VKTINVSEATNTQLNWLVAKCEGVLDEDIYPRYSYTTSPEAMWPIIDRERISIRYWDNVDLIHAYMPAADEWEEGATGLIAAARAYIVFKLGEVVEVPEELI